MLMLPTLCRVYVAGSKGAVIYCLHGCGYTGLTWALVAAAVKDRYIKKAYLVINIIYFPLCLQDIDFWFCCDPTIASTA